MRIPPALVVALVALALAPIGAADGGPTRAFEHRFDGAGWVSLIVAFDGTGLAELKQRYETGPIGDWQRTREPASMVVVQLEQLRADGTWFWWAGAYAEGASKEANRADVNVSVRPASENARVQIPGGLTPHQGGARGGIGLLAGAGQVHRFTAWGAGDAAGEFWMHLDLPPTARLLASAQGEEVLFFDAAHDPTIGARAQANQFGGGVRTGAEQTFDVNHRAYIASIIPIIAADGRAVAEYQGPAAGWDGPSGDHEDIVNGPSGTYRVHSLADISISWRDAIAGTLGGESRDTPAMWLFADVTPAEMP